MVDEVDVARVVEVLDPQRALHRIERGLRGRHRLVLLVVEVVGAGELGLVLALGDFRVAGAPSSSRTMRAKSWYVFAAVSGSPEMISGVRASSIRIESTSSTIANEWLRWTRCSAETAMLSRR